MIGTSILGGLMGDQVGRRMSLLLIAPFSIIGFLCQALAQDVLMLQFGRFIIGLASGLTCAPTGVRI